MTFLPRTRTGWVAWLLLIIVAAVIGSVVSPASGAIGFGLLAVVFGSVLVVMAEAWRADIWGRSKPPARIPPGRAPDYVVWLLRHRRNAP